ncbi:MAG: glycosyltransferase [Bacteroidia bacterium]|nr:glycosyltransferase [Bacteroidia bacterium]
MAHPSVAILTVVRNDLAGLKATVTAVQSLTYPNWSHHIQDGASTDGTPGWLAQAGLPRTTWVSAPDSGLYDAMNRALHTAEADFVWFLNAGDLPASPEVLDRAFAHWRGEDIVYGDTELIDTEGRPLGLRRHKRLPRQLRRGHLRLGMVVGHQSLLVRRSLAPDYDTRYRIAADIDWTIRLLTRTRRTLNAQCALSRFETGGVSSQRHRASLWERWQILRRHFGLPLAALSHLEIALRAVGRKLGLPV